MVEAAAWGQVDVRLAVTDSPVGDLPWKITCREPAHEDPTRSMAVYADHLHCYGCGKHIKYRLHALAYLLGITPAQAREVASKYTSAAVDAYRVRVAQEVKREPLPGALATVYQGMLLPAGMRGHRRAWLHERGLEDWIIDRARLGHDTTRFVIPFFAPNRDMRTNFQIREHLLTLRFRRDDEYGTEYPDGQPIPKYVGMRGRNGLYLYPEHWLDRRPRDWVVVCEGELDALRLWQEDIPAVSTTNGAGNLHHIPDLLKDYPYIRRLFIAADQDEAGALGAKKLDETARARGFRVSRAIWDEQTKDVTELYKAGGSLREVSWHGDETALPN